MVIVLVGEIEAVEYFSITISFLIAKKEPRLSTMADRAVSDARGGRDRSLLCALTNNLSPPRTDTEDLPTLNLN